MSNLTTTTESGQVIVFEADNARALVTAHTAVAQVEARNKNIDAALDHANKAISIQRAFVLWWDAQEKDKGGGDTRSTGDRSVTGVKLEDVAPDLDKKTISRWRSALVVKNDPNDTSKLENAIQKANQKIAKICGFDVSGAHVANNSGENEWYTPAIYIEAARAVMGSIDVDPASCERANETVKANRYFTSENSGLEANWAGNVWMNPPYSRPLVSQFAQRLLSEVESGNTTAAIVLVNNFTDTQDGQSLLRRCNAVCFAEKRIRFIDKNGEPSGAPLQGQMFLYFGEDVAAFAAFFSAFGAVLEQSRTMWQLHG